MKNLIFCLSIVTLLLSLYSCNEDESITPNDVPESALLAADDNSPNAGEDRTCSMEQHMTALMSDPAYRKAHQEKLTRIENYAAVRSANCTNPAVLPMAIHFQGISNPDEACLRALAISQIAVLNADFQGTNSDISNWDNNASSSFPGISNGDACIEFCLPTQGHPSGFNLSDGEPAVTINQTSGDNASQWNGYINIFVRANLGALGYSPLGGNGNGDGVSIDANAFGTGAGCGSIAPGAPYNLGRTLTHELGHYLLLDHIWGGNGGCNDDDQVNDTPVSNQPYYGCPSIGASSCSSTDMHMNYMDYTNDACMYMFSAGQATRVEGYVNTSLQNVIAKGNTICGGPTNPTPTCSDGIQNGNETGVDCGGPDCEPCQAAPTCSDGIQNGNETGVDCGGPDCEPCQAAPTCTDGIQNGNETGVDCGGPDCAPCAQPLICDAPENVSATNITNNSALITWEPVNGAIRYQIRYKEAGQNPWKSRLTTNTERVLNNLQSGTKYRYRVRTFCEDDRSKWSDTKSFITESNTGTECSDNELNFDLTLDYYGGETSWEIYDESGSVVYSGDNYPNYQEGLNIQENWCLEDGCYTFAIYDDYGDGICCDYGEGSYSIADGNGNVLFESDGYFSYVEYVDFCLGYDSFNSVQNRKGKKARNTVKKAKPNQTRE